MPDQAILDRVRRLIPDAIVASSNPQDQLPDAPGAYALLIHLPQPVTFRRNAIGEATLDGWLTYAGSAKGPGGMRARLSRHFRRDKPVRWHVDELTTKADLMAALALPGGNKCAIVDALLASQDFEVAMPGFGSSDCPRCPAHLLRPVT